jgi:hypothetical protein
MIILDKEHMFLLKLIEKLGDKYDILKSQNKYCAVDFIIINKYNLKTLYIEHKFRNTTDKSDTLFIGKTKIENLLTNYINSIIIWEFSNDIYYSIEVCEELVKQSTMSYIRGCYALEIIKSQCNNSIDLLIKNIIEKLEN